MKKFFLSTSALFLFALLFAKDVDKNQALQVAKNFYQQATIQTIPVEHIQLVYECRTPAGVGRSSDDRPVYYVFNVNQHGFIIVSGDDLVQPVLGYSESSSYTLNDLAPSLKKWMNNYEKQIVYVKENVSSTTAEITRMWADYTSGVFSSPSSRGTAAVNPLCQTQWNQSPYENAMCPYDNNHGERTVTGCVATAMAQIMKFWNYPTQGTGFHSYNDQNYGSQSANFGSTTYQWAQMANQLSSANSAVATLMYHCGVSVDMHYGVGATGGSSAYVVASESPVQACAEYSYKTYFGYDPATLQGVVRQNYTDANWTNLLKTEMDNGRPVQYAGFGNGGGHTWVCDGYDQNNYFHMNWGWGGNSDGFFSLNNLDPTSLGAGGGTGGFNGSQQAVIGIKPLNGGGGGGGGGTVNQDGIQLYAATTVSANPVVSGSQFSVYATIANGGTSDFTGDFAAAIFNNNGVFVDFIQEFTNQTAQAGMYYNVTFTMNQLSAVPGNYIIGIFYKNGSNNYSLINPNSFVNPVSITVTGTYNDIQMYSAGSVSPATPKVNQPFSIGVDIANYGSTNFSGYLSADLFTLEGAYVTNIQELSGINIQAGYYNTEQFSTSGLNVAPGTYYVAFFSSTDHSNWPLVYTTSYPNPFEITITGATLTPDMYENNDAANSAYPLTATFNGNNAGVSTPGSNQHVGNDYDYYKVTLPAGTNYAITARVHDSYNSGNGNTYTNDVQFSYSVNGGSWSDSYDDVMPGTIVVQNGGTVTFFVSDYFTGTTGDYLLDLSIARGANVGIHETELTEVKVFPNPASDNVWIDAGELQGNCRLSVFNQMGQMVMNQEGTATNNPVKVNISALASGIYTVQLKAANIIGKSKIVKQ